jgi:hypothetical protein
MNVIAQTNSGRIEGLSQDVLYEEERLAWVSVPDIITGIV